MRWMDFDKSACVFLMCFVTSISLTTPAQSPATAKATPHILEANEGERRVLRGWPGHPNPGESFALKIDPKNGGSSRLVLLTFDLGKGGEIAKHRHPNADEILFLQSGTAKVRLGDSVREIHSGATVFIPAGKWISVSNIGIEPIKAVAVFSAPGFEEYMRDVSVREGEKNVPLSESEDAAIAKKHSHDVIYKEQ